MSIKSTQHHLFTGTTQAYSSGYDSTKTMLGQWIQQKSGGGVGNYAGPFPITAARPFEDAGFGAVYPSAVQWTTSVQWVFMADVTANSAAANILAYTFNTATQVWTYLGKITMTLPAGNHTVTGLNVQRHTYTTGTVGRANGTGDIVGVGTAWVTSRLAPGRIGISSTNPALIGTWRQITSIDDNTHITTPAGSGGNFALSTYILEDLRVYITTTCDTATNGGLFVAKGISIDDFVGGGTTIAAATTTDNLKKVYWLKDASTITNTTPSGIAASPTRSDTSHMLYVVNGGGTTSMKVFKYDVRAALTVSSGASTNAFSLKTGTETVTGNIGLINSITMATTSHGSGTSISSIYGVTNSRIYRIQESAIVDASTTFVADSAIEAPPGVAYFATGALQNIFYCDTIDRFMVLTSSNAYLTRYNTVPSLFDRTGLIDCKQQDQSTADAGVANFPNISDSAFAGCNVNGVAYLLKGATTQPYSQIYALPIGADWDFAAGSSATYQNRLITPALTTAQCLRYSKLGVLYDPLIGSDKLGQPPEPFRVFWRTGGIADDTGSWNPVVENWDLSGISGSQQIQFMFEFRTFGPICIPARIFGLIVTYDKITPHANFASSVANSSGTSKRFAWRFHTGFSSVVPTLTIRLYDVLSNELLLTDTTATQVSGTFEKSTNDGSSWVTYDTADKTNETTYIRYTPTYLGDNIKVKAFLT